MKSFKINDDQFNLIDINLILVNEQAASETKTNYFISVFTTHGRYDYYEFPKLEFAQAAIHELRKFFMNHSVYNFACINNQFLINMHNTCKIKLDSNLTNQHRVQASFVNGSKINLYTGFDYKTAKYYINTYQRQLDKYSFADTTSI